MQVSGFNFLCLITFDANESERERERERLVLESTRQPASQPSSKEASQAATSRPAKQPIRRTGGQEFTDQWALWAEVCMASGWRAGAGGGL